MILEPLKRLARGDNAGLATILAIAIAADRKSVV